MTMHAKRLLKAADITEATPKARLNMAQWGLPRDPDPFCGFVGCAIGNCALNPYFRKLGLRLRYDRSEGDETARSAKVLYVDPKTDFCYDGWDAVAALFGLSIGDAEYLFAPWAYLDDYAPSDSDPEAAKAITPARVARRIRKFVENGGER